MNTSNAIILNALISGVSELKNESLPPMKHTQRRGLNDWSCPIHWKAKAVVLLLGVAIITLIFGGVTTEGLIK